MPLVLHSQASKRTMEPTKLIKTEWSKGPLRVCHLAICFNESVRTIRDTPTHRRWPLMVLKRTLCISKWWKANATMGSGTQPWSKANATIRCKIQPWGAKLWEGASESGEKWPLKFDLGACLYKGNGMSHCWAT